VDLHASAANGKSWKALYDECDTKNVFGGKALPIRAGRRLRCSDDPNRVSGISKYPDGTVVFTAKMAVDADGSPVLGGSGWPNDVETWLEFDPGSETHFVNAEEVPFVVIPQAVPHSGLSFGRDTGIGKGDLAVVTRDGKCSFGIVGDIGPWFRLGESSLRAHDELGNPQCEVFGEHPCRKLKNGSGVGISSGVTYIVFPHTRPRPLLSQTINSVAVSEGAEKVKSFVASYGNSANK
jgi:hypothetical protein